MKNSNLVEVDELASLTRQGVQRAIQAKAKPLSEEEIDQVSGGAFVVTYPVATNYKFLVPFKWGIIDPEIFNVDLGNQLLGNNIFR